MKKLLIAEHSQVMVEELYAALQEQWEIYSCDDGIKALELLRNLQPDAMIIDLGMPKKSGLEVLAESFPDLPPFIVALSASISPFITEYAARWGVDFLFQIPFNMDLLLDCMGSVPQIRTVAANRTAQHLRVLGVSAGRSGYYCLMLAVPFQQEDFSQHLHKEVYCRVASCLRTDARAVERAIRTAIQHAYTHRNPDIWTQYFPVNNYGEVECPSNKEFIVTLAQRI